MTIPELMKQAHKTATDKGFHDEKHTIPHYIAMIMSELGEAINADRKGKYCNGIKGCFADFESEVKDTFEDEMADAVIRIFDLCQELEIDLESHIEAKMAFNKTRPRLNGSLY